MRGGRRRAEDGAATLLVLAASGVLLLVAAAVAGVVGLVHAHRVAQSAADLAALAGAQELVAGRDGCRAAGAVSEANGAELVACRARSGSVRVEVAVPVPEALRRTGLVAAETLRGTARAGPAQDAGGS